MDENINTQGDQENMAAPPPPAPKQPQQVPSEPQAPAADSGEQPAPSGVVYATFLQRLGAILIDTLLLIVVGAILGSFAGEAMAKYNAISTLIWWVYLVAMDIKFGATLGKMALGIRVQDIETGQNLSVVSAILREVVGRFLSGLVILLGYFWMIWDDKKQTWHDKFGKSVVVKK